MKNLVPTIDAYTFLSACVWEGIYLFLEITLIKFMDYRALVLIVFIVLKS